MLIQGLYMSCRQRKRDLRTYANNENHDQPARPQYRTKSEDLDPTTQTGMGLRHSYMPSGPFCQREA